MAEPDAGPAPEKARFVTGSTMRHVLVMAGAGAAGLVALFAIDFINLFYISLLGDPSLTAAVGYATTLLFFYTSVAIGVMIAATALVAKALGREDRQGARELAGSSIVWMLVITGGATLATLPFVDGMVHLIGARGETHAVAALFMWIVMPTTPILALGMCLTGLLRAVGDARRSMFTTLTYGLVVAALDPLLILALGWGVPGAAIAAVAARIAMVAYALHALLVHHKLIARPTLAHTLRDFRPLAAIGGPAILTNIATPVGNGYVTAAIAPFGDEAVAGWTVVSRLIPVAFGGLFALAGAVGPVLAQNYGAEAYHRVRGAMNDALTVSTIYVVAVSALLLVAQSLIVSGFRLTGEAADIVEAFCTYLAITFVFAGGLFVSNAAFNNLGYATLSTLFNWGRVTLGAAPFIWVGGQIAGGDGVVAGFMIGGVPFGIAAMVVCYRVIGRLGEERPRRSLRAAIAGLLPARRGSTANN
ncbi:MATE family efflux transporter [Bauldia sp.]|uniref:MATE family efflux transporter n=1 Tax=Bauldia sp. TaxID=2575872 RepID=UPI003BA92761